MNSYFRLVLTLMFLCLATTLYAWGAKEKSQAEPEVATIPETKVVQVTGWLRSVGSEPLNELVITGTDGEWYVAREEQHKLKDLRYRTVTVEGTVTILELKADNGMPTLIFPTLSNITIIAIE